MSAIPLMPSDPAYPKAYTVVLSGTDESGAPIGYNGSKTIVASLPESFDLSSSANYSALFPSPGLSEIAGASIAGTGLGGLGTFGANAANGAALAGKAAGITKSAGGFTDVFPLFSQMYWVHTDPISFTLNLQFDAVYDAKAEVTANIQSLINLTLPSLDGAGTLRAPGPALLSKLTNNQYSINLTIGTAWTFTDVLITSVHATINTLPTSTGDYISATCSVGICLNRIYTKQDMAKAFSGTAQDSPTDPLQYLANTFSGNGSFSDQASAAGNALSRGFGAVRNAVSGFI